MIMARKEKGPGGGSGDREGAFYEFQDRDNYNFVLTQHLVILAQESTSDGLTENYVHGVFSYQNKLPSKEWESHPVHPSEIARLNVIRKHIIRKLGLDEKENDIKELKEGATHLEIFEWALGLDPDFFHLYPNDKEECPACDAQRIGGRPCPTCGLDEKKVMNFYQTIVLEIMAVDLSDDMESLRKKTPFSAQAEGEFGT